jgi:tetratricopeptide (TPR) repeat protein
MVPHLLRNLAVVQSDRGRHAEAERLAREALEIARRLLGDRHPTALASMGPLGVSLVGMGRLDEAEAILRPRFEAAREIYGDDHSGTIEAAIDLARVCREQPKLQSEAEALLLRSRESARRIGSDLKARIDLELGYLYQQMGRLREAEPVLWSAEDECDKNPDLAPGRRIRFKTELSKLYLSMGQPGRALEKSREALALCEERYGADHHRTYDVLGAMAAAAQVAGRLDEAEALYTRLIGLVTRVHGPENRGVFVHQANIAAILHVRGRFELAERHYRESLEGLRRTGRPDEPLAIDVLSNLGEFYRDWGRYEPAEALLKQAVQAELRVYGPDHPRTLWTVWKIAEMDRDRGRLDEAGASFRRCIEGNLKAQGPEGLDVATLRADLGLNELRRGEPARAEPLFREALRVYDKAMPENWRRFEIQGQLGESLAAQKKFAEAEPLILGGYEGLTARRKDVTVDAWSRLPEAGRRVVRLYEAWGKSAEADRWRKKIPPEAGPDKKPGAANAADPNGGAP